VGKMKMGRLAVTTIPIHLSVDCMILVHSPLHINVVIVEEGITRKTSVWISSEIAYVEI
jgi:hypothetical protein